jgi:hypothetical protein
MATYYELRIQARKKTEATITKAINTDPNIQIRIDKLCLEITKNIAVGEKPIKQQIELMVEDGIIKYDDSDKNIITKA